jgi:hypothetical protein
MNRSFNKVKIVEALKLFGVHANSKDAVKALREQLVQLIIQDQGQGDVVGAVDDGPPWMDPLAVLNNDEAPNIPNVGFLEVDPSERSFLHSDGASVVSSVAPSAAGSSSGSKSSDPDIDMPDFSGTCKPKPTVAAVMNRSFDKAKIVEALQLFGVHANSKDAAKALREQLVQLIIQDQGQGGVIGAGMLLDCASAQLRSATDMKQPVVGVYNPATGMAGLQHCMLPGMIGVQKVHPGMAQGIPQQQQQQVQVQQMQGHQQQMSPRAQMPDAYPQGTGRSLSCAVGYLTTSRPSSQQQMAAAAAAQMAQYSPAQMQTHMMQHERQQQTQQQLQHPASSHTLPITSDNSQGFLSTPTPECDPLKIRLPLNEFVQHLHTLVNIKLSHLDLMMIALQLIFQVFVEHRRTKSKNCRIPTEDKWLRIWSRSNELQLSGKTPVAPHTSSRRYVHQGDLFSVLKGFLLTQPMNAPLQLHTIKSRIQTYNATSRHISAT